MFSISVKDIQEQQDIKEAKRLEIYKKILERCFRTIKNCADQEQAYCLFSVPPLKIGIPLYNMQKCIDYLHIKLKEKGFQSRQLGDSTTIFISWQIQQPDIKKLEYRKPLRLMEAPKEVSNEPEVETDQETGGGWIPPPKSVVHFPMNHRIKLEPKSILKKNVQSIYQFQPPGKSLY